MCRPASAKLRKSSATFRPFPQALPFPLSPAARSECTVLAIQVSLSANSSCSVCCCCVSGRKPKITNCCEHVRLCPATVCWRVHNSCFLAPFKSLSICAISLFISSTSRFRLDIALSVLKACCCCCCCLPVRHCWTLRTRTTRRTPEATQAMCIAWRQQLITTTLSCALAAKRMRFPTEKCTFLQKNAFSCRKCTFLHKNAVFEGAHHRKPQEIAGKCQGSIIKNASPTFTRTDRLQPWCTTSLQRKTQRCTLQISCSAIAFQIPPIL